MIFMGGFTRARTVASSVREVYCRVIWFIGKISCRLMGEGFIFFHLLREIMGFILWRGFFDLGAFFGNLRLNIKCSAITWILKNLIYYFNTK